MIQMRQPEDALRAFQTAWNSHDMKSLGVLFHEDATFVNRFGHYVRGVEAIIKLHAPIHATIYSDSTPENDLIDVVAIGDDAAVLHFWSRLTVGAAHRPFREIVSHVDTATRPSAQAYVPYRTLAGTRWH